MKLFNWLKKDDEDEFNPEVIERKARAIANNLADMTEKYDERTEEVIELLREKAEGLWSCRQYYDGAMQLKNEVKNLKAEKSDKLQELSQLRRQWSSMAEHILESNMCKKPSTIDNYEDFITYLQLIQFIDKENIPIRNLKSTMKKLHIDKEEIERDYTDLYNNLKMKDW